MGFSQTLWIGVVCAVSLVLGGCYDFAKARASWSCTYVAAMSPEGMTTQAAEAFHAAKIGRFRMDAKYDIRYVSSDKGKRPAPMYYRTSFSEHFVTQTPEWSMTMLWRRGVWLVTGAPTCILFAIPTFGLSLQWLAGPVNIFAPGVGTPKSLGEALGRNTTDIRFNAVEIVPGLSVATCEIESMGMVSDARRMKNALWRELGTRFPQDGPLEWTYPAPPPPTMAPAPTRRVGSQREKQGDSLPQ